MKQSLVIAPSILSADFARLGEDCARVISAGADWIHVDVMDNHYVPNLTMGPVVVQSLKKYGLRVPLDVHLMITPVDAIIPAFVEAGADLISFHPEATLHADRTLSLIRDLGCKAGLVLNITTPLDVLQYCLPKVDYILLMSVNPGFGGQSFDPLVLHKVREVRTLIDQSDYPIRLSVDGGIKPDNIALVYEAGADTFVMGSAVFNAPDYAAVFSDVRSRIATVK